ncbi:MFS transporter [Phycicoccus flavus]|uniref:MFS transporter n=1 Tax=Phycicoccus flavus TaxID=2502783 RepID=UPI000FEBF2DA|nr:MFS transporter [Phycicoccus flavus]NHA67957.1 MFS transporter [Phycicoccus flavus]
MDGRTDGARDEPFSLRRIAVPAFAPTALWSVGLGATAPVIALSARDLGASVAVAALFVGLGTVSELASAIPAGLLVDRVGERRALVVAGVADAAAALLALLAPTLWVFALAVVLAGPTGAVFLLARQSYLTAAAPESMRARAMSTLGGVARIGLFVGPFLAAPVVHAGGPRAAFAIAVAGGLLAAGVAWGSPDLGAHGPGATVPGGLVVRTRVAAVVREHRGVLATVGLGVLAIGLARSSRVVVVPLWAESVGLTAAQTALVFGVAGLVEVLLFYPAGSLMDRRGRVWVAVPVTVTLGVGLLVLPLTSTLAAVGAVSVLMAVGNGLGSGIVMTLGADAAPRTGRAAFLGVWRLLSLVGHNGASLVVAAVAAAASIGAASVAVGVLTLGGGAWLLRWLPRYDPRRRDPAVGAPD